MKTTVRVFVVAVALLTVLGGVAGVASAQTGGEEFGGLVEVAEGETVDGDFNAVGGTVLVAGTVTGDVEATGGTVIVARTGVVEGSVSAIGGAVVLEGRVGGDVDVSAGSVLVREGATVGGDLTAVGGSVQFDGDVAGTANLAGESVQVGPAAVVGGDVVYEAESFAIAPSAAVAGTVSVGDVVPRETETAPPALPRGVGAVYGLLANLLLGVALLLVVPRFSASVATAGTTRALRSGGYGLLALVGVPLLLVLVAVTIVGIPLSLAGAVTFAALLWVAFVYGALVAGTWAVGELGRESRWLALLVGVVFVAVVDVVPFVGGVVQFGLLVLGLGAFVLAAQRLRRDDDEGGFVFGANTTDEGGPTA